MRYAAIDNCECVNAIGWGITLYVQGCGRHCPGCFNPETWDFNQGQIFTEKEIQYIINLYQQRPEYTHLVVEGGEPLESCNWKKINSLLTNIRIYLPHIKIWLYTGYTYEELLKICAENKEAEQYLFPIITSLIDIMVDGPFVQEEKDITLAFKGSNNQRVIDCAETLKQNKIVLYNLK